MDPTSRTTGFARADLVALLVIGALLAGFGAPPSISRGATRRRRGPRATSWPSGTAHAAYAADWNDRQFTVVRDDLGAFGGDCRIYRAAAGPHPPLVLGDDCQGVTRGFFFETGCADFDVVRPINFDGPLAGLGSFRVPNARGFHEYVNGRFFDPTFFAPKDAVVLDVVEPLLDVDCEYAATGIDGLPFASSYVLSPAAMLDPRAFANPSQGGFRSPDALKTGYRSPSVSQATYPAQKTRMIEHHWLQIPDAPCNPAFERRARSGRASPTTSTRRAARTP